jgi:hypothetical protein
VVVLDPDQVETVVLGRARRLREPRPRARSARSIEASIYSYGSFGTLRTDRSIGTVERPASDASKAPRSTRPGSYDMALDEDRHEHARPTDRGGPCS